MEQTINANLNNADCIKTVENIGSRTYVNICTKSQTVVPWGSIDWIGVGVIIFLIILAGFVFKLIIED